MKAIVRIYHPNEKDVLRFSIKKVNTKLYKSLTNEDKKDALLFLNDCIDDLKLFQKELYD